jgi:hypothetical protein
MIGVNGGIMTMQKTVYTPEQMKRRSEVHRILCTERNINPQSLDGRLVADKCTGDEPNEVIIQRVSH